MKLGYSCILSLLFLFQNVQVSQSAALVLNEDGTDSPLGAIVCFLIPCADPSLGARNFFAPVATGSGGAGSSGPPTPGETGEGTEGTILQQLVYVGGQIVQAVLDERQQEDEMQVAGGDPAREREELNLRIQLRDVAIGFINGLLAGQNGGEDEETPSEVGNAEDEDSDVVERLRVAAVGLVMTIFNRLGDGGDGGTRRRLRGQVNDKQQVDKLLKLLQQDKLSDPQLKEQKEEMDKAAMNTFMLGH
ncbi:expressed unknown protein [Seminavis robusta]|uniref:Uncharacterized protein n=1 Tax=Seminavis robusta TaxID=568900 RepID=A0A9N8HBQ4_9STRA|nr:expressed unknown protein [Seminavis robusta]|eukprot:Sro191_g082140.1 n/a (247) ;mRNA; r:24558-25298